MLAGLAALALALLSIVGVYLRSGDRSPTDAPDEGRAMLAVMPFSNTSPHADRE